MAPHSSTLAWKIPWMEDSFGEGNGNPLQYSCLENPMGGGAWWATIHGVTKSWTRLSDFTFTFHFCALEKEMATHSSVLAWRIPWMDPGLEARFPARRREERGCGPVTGKDRAPGKWPLGTGQRPAEAAPPLLHSRTATNTSTEKRKSDDTRVTETVALSHCCLST